MPVKDEIAGLDRRAAASLKAQRIAEVMPSMTRPFQRDGVRYTIGNRNFGTETVNALTMLWVRFEAKVANTGEVIIALDDPANPHYFVNPPIMVPDGVDAEGKPKFKEDLAEALRQMIQAKVRDRA
jgi:hypothetical protein